MPYALGRWGTAGEIADAARELAPGHSFSPRDRHLEEFEATFPYEETPDQLAAIDDTARTGSQSD